MPRPKSLSPKYRLYAPKQLAVVRIEGKDHYLGAYNSPESLEEYHRLIADLHARRVDGRIIPKVVPENGFFGVNNLIEQYLAHARTYYARDGKPGKEYTDMEYATEPLSLLLGLTNANEFGPKALKTLRQHMIDQGLSRGVVNSRINRVRRVFKWGVEEELVQPSVYHGLQAVAGLRFGRSNARETEPVKPVADEHIQATLPFVHRQVRTMIELQRLTGMRPCEVVMIRPCDIDRDGDVWVYEPHDHKNRWRGHRRLIPLGPKARQLLRPFLNRAAEAYCFSPHEAEQERNAERRANRKSPMTPSQAQRRRKPKPKRPKRERYDTDSYRRAITYGIKMANKARQEGGPEIPAWYPLQIRHTRATEVRRQYGLDGAQSALGHKNADVTQVYAEKNMELAVRIAKETG